MPNINALVANSKPNSFLKLKAGPTSLAVKSRKHLHILVDTGNRCGVGLINELTYRAMCPRGQLEKVKVVISAAGQDQFLSCVGRSVEPIELQFYDKISQAQLFYSFRPLVIRNLQLPMLLSSKDLSNIGAIIHVRDNKISVKNPKGEVITLPLTDIPKISLSNSLETLPQVGKGHMCQKIVLKDNEEAVFQVSLDPKNFNVGETVSVEMCTDIKAKYGLVDSCVVDKIRPGHKVHFRVFNPNTHIVSIPQYAEVAHVSTLDSEFLEGEKFEKVFENVNVLNEQYELLEDNVDVNINATTRKGLAKQIATDLKFEKDGHDLSKSERLEIIQLFMRHRTALALSPEEVGTVKGIEVTIPTGDHPPISQKCRPLNRFMVNKLKDQIQKWLKQAVISPCNGPWASPLVPVPKKDGRIRFAVDYRKLNSITTKDSRPIANISEKLANLKSPREPFKYFATLDLSEAYHCVKIKESDKEKTAMITPLGLFKFNRMSFGLTSAPQAFHQVVTMIEKNLFEKDKELSKAILLYFDDCIIPGTSFEDLKQKLDLFLKTITELGLKVNPAKCEIGSRELKWLGHTVSEKGIRPDQDRVQTLENWPPPKNLGEVRAVHGLLSYFRKFIRNFAARSQHIRAQLKKEGLVDWDINCQKEFLDLKNELLQKPLLGHPDFSDESKPFVITVDTSSLGTGSVLSQTQIVEHPVSKKLESREVIISYASRRLTQGESSYSSYKLELSGLVSAIEHFRFYLIGRKFLVRTDNKALSWLLKTRSEQVPPLLFRWQQILQGYDFTIEFISGTANKLADAISRKGYRHDDYGDMLAPKPRREPLWEAGTEPITPKQAKTSILDDVWLPLMKCKFSKNNVMATTRLQAQTKAFHPGGGQQLTSQPNFQNSETASNSSKNETPYSNDEFELVESFTENDLKECGQTRSFQLPSFEQLLSEREKETESFVNYLLGKQQESVALKLIFADLTNNEWPKDYTDARKKLVEFLALHSSQELDKEQKEKNILLYLLLTSKRNDLSLDINGLIRLNSGPNKCTIIIPIEIVHDIIHFIHHGAGSAHLGQSKTNKIFCKYFYSPNIKIQIQKFINTCSCCQDGKKLNPNFSPGLSKTTSIICARLSRFYIDCVKMVKGRLGHQYLFTLLDTSTRWLEAFPIRCAKASTIGRILKDEIFPRYGPNLLFVSDNGKEFTANLIKNLMMEFSQKHYFGSAYHPNSNAVERTHRTLIGYIKAELSDKQLPREKWVDCLPAALLNLRMAPDSSGSSPFERVYGLSNRSELSNIIPDPYQSIDLVDTKILDENADSITIENSDPESKKKLVRTLKKINSSTFAENVACLSNDSSIPSLSVQEFEQAKKDEAATKSHVYNKEYRDNKSKLFVPHCGELVDRVLHQDPESLDSRKFQRPYDGPYIVVSENNHFKAQIASFNLQTQKAEGRPFQVFSGHLRPTLALCKLSRRTWRIPWAHS